MPMITLKQSFLSSSSFTRSQASDEEKAISSTDVSLVSRESTHDDNAIKGALCIFGTFMGLFSTFGQINAFGTFQAWYAENQLSHMSSSAISWIGSSQLCTFFISGWLFGRIFDAYGPRRLLILGTSLNVFSLMMTSISRTYAEFLLTQGIAFGLGSAMVFYPAVASVSSHYTNYKATAIGIALAGTSIGGIVFPIITHKLLITIGFAKSVRVLALICFTTCVTATITVSSRREHGGARTGSWMNIKSVLDTSFLMLTAGCMIAAFGLFIPYILIVEYATSSHLTSVSLYVLSTMNGGGALGRVVPAMISDMYGRFNLLFASAFLAGASCFALWLPTTLEFPSATSSGNTAATVVAFGVVYGIFSGAFISLVNPCIFQISKTEQEGTRMGALNTLVAIPTLLGGPIGGALQAAGHDRGFKYVAIFSGISLLLGSAIISIIRIRLSKGNLFVKV